MMEWEDEASITHSFTVVLVGEPCAGKSCLARCCTTGSYPDVQRTTVGADLVWCVVRVGPWRVRVMLWATSGAETAFALLPARGRRAADAVVVTVDSTNPRGPARLPSWLELGEGLAAGAGGAQTGLLCVVATKCDRVAERVLQRACVRRAARARCMPPPPFFETSALTGAGVRTWFGALLRALVLNAEGGVPRPRCDRRLAAPPSPSPSPSPPPTPPPPPSSPSAAPPEERVTFYGLVRTVLLCLRLRLLCSCANPRRKPKPKPKSKPKPRSSPTKCLTPTPVDYAVPSTSRDEVVPMQPLSMDVVIEKAWDSYSTYRGSEILPNSPECLENK